MTYFTVEVAYASVDDAAIVRLSLPPGATVADAITRSGLLQRFPEIDLATQKVGVFGKLANLKQTLRPHDRVEIYRPLTADAKELRRQRALLAAKLKKTRAKT